MLVDAVLVAHFIPGALADLRGEGLGERSVYHDVALVDEVPGLVAGQDLAVRHGRVEGGLEGLGIHAPAAAHWHSKLSGERPLPPT